jgi:hypothetical protein
MKAYLISNLLMVSFIIVFSLGCEKKSNNAENRSTSGSMGGTTSGPVIEEETEVVEELPNETDRYFDEALKAFQKKNYKASSENINKGISSINKELEASGEKSSPELRASLNNLKMLSKDVQAGKIKSEDVLKNAFAQTDAKLADDYLVITEVYVTKQQPDKLEKGLGHISSALKRGTRIVEAETKDAYEAVSRKAEELRTRIKNENQKGGKSDMAALKRELDDVKRDVQDVERRLDQSSASAKNNKK